MVAFGGGILTADFVGYDLPRFWLALWAFALLFPLLNLLFPRPQRWISWLANGLLLLAVFASGGWRASTTYLPERADFFAHHLEAGDLLGGEVIGIKPATKTMRAEVRLTQRFREGSPTTKVSGNVLLYLAPDERTAHLRPGAQIIFTGQPETFRQPLNPGVFDLGAYWHRQHVHHQLFVRSPSDWRTVGQSTGGLIARAEGWRRAWFRTFQDHLQGDKLAVAAALVLGDRDGLTKEIKSAYTDTGAVHVLAVSGLHVGIIFLILRFLLVSLLRLDRRKHGDILVAVLSIVCVWGFALISGLSASVQRAGIMFTILAIGGIGKLKSHVFNTLSLAAIGMLLIDPAQLFRVGFQLSFTAIIGIVAFADPINRLVYLPAKWLRGGWSAMAASTGAQLGTLPLSLLYFKQFPLYFLLSGTVVILSAFAIMFCGLLHGFMAGIIGFSPGAKLTGWLLGSVVSVQNNFIFFFQKLPGALLQIPYFDWVASLLLAVGIGCLAVFARWRRMAVLVTAIFLLLATIFWARTQGQSERGKTGLTVYHLAKSSLVDVYAPDGRAWSLGQQPAAENLDWSAGPNRRTVGYEPLKTFPLPTGKDTTLAPGLTLQNERFTVGNTHWLTLNGRDKSPQAEDLTGVTHLLVINDFRLENLPDFSGDNPPLIVLDGSIPFYRYDDWKAKATDEGWPLYLTAEAGAFVWPTTGDTH